jgi:curli biogenesis system outer membrane secretion channel CsgG
MSRFIALLVATLLSGGAAADYLAYSITDSDRSPLPRKVGKVQAKYLVNLGWGNYEGKRARVGVLEVDNTSSAGSFTITTIGGNVDYGGANTQVPMNGIEAIVTDTMNRTGRFRLVERQVLGDVLGEQDLAASGRVSAPSGAATGKVLGAQFLVQVVVTDYESKIRGSGGGLGGFVTRRIPALGGVGISSGEGRIGLNFRLIDAVTSEVVFTKQIESIIKEGGFTVAGGALLGDIGLGGFYGSYKKTPIGQAMIAGINKGVYELVQQIGAAPAEGSVIKAAASEIWINLGADVVSIGEQLQVMKKGEELIDPETGISLGSSDTPLGNIEVRQVREKFSIARPASLFGVPSRGDKVISLAPPPSIEFASSFRVPRR